MRLIINSLTSVILLGASAAMTAQDGGVLKCYVSFGQNIAQNHAATMTGTPYGGPGAFQAEFGVEFLHPQSTLLVRPNVGYTRILSKDPDQILRTEISPVDPLYPPISTMPNATAPRRLYDLFGIYTGFDLVWNVSKSLPLTATFGPSFHWWSVERAGVLLPNRPQGDRSAKLGVRFGVEYTINETFRTALAYTMTEWRSYSGTYIEGFNPSTPCYFTLKGVYKF